MLHCAGAAAPDLAVAVGLADPTLAETSSATSAPAASTVFLRIILFLREAVLRSQACVRTRHPPDVANLPTASEPRGDVLVTTW